MTTILNKTHNIAIIIMAAGNSSRMGSPKQLLPWKNSTLIETVIETSLGIDPIHVSVVLGANKPAISSRIERFPVAIVYNKTWNEGLSNSIAQGVLHIQNLPNVEGVMIVLADQPLISTTYLKEMLNCFKSGQKQIIATQYPNNKQGVPVLFDKHYFDELSKLEGDKGAKKILEENKDRLLTLEAKEVTVDVDTKEDYNELIKRST